MLSVVLLAALVGPASASPPPDAPAASGVPSAPVGSSRIVLDILRTSDVEAERSSLYVQALLPDGHPGLFLVDSGADVSVMTEETAERLDLPIERNFGTLEGLGGTTPFHLAASPIQLGDTVLPHVEFAVGLRGLPQFAGTMPLDGILGTNVWAQFDMEIDYKNDRIYLYEPGTMKLPRKTAPMRFIDNKVFTTITITTDTRPTREARLAVQVDTGAHGLLITGNSKLDIDALGGDPPAWTQGVEPIAGLGAADNMPPSAFLRQTRRLPLSTVAIGGSKVPVNLDALWYAYDAATVGPRDMGGLLGHEILEGHRVLFAFERGKFAVANSRRPERKLDGHEVFLAQDLERYGADPSRGLIRGRLLAALERYDESELALIGFLGQPEPTDADGRAVRAEARMTLSEVRRLRGDLAGATEMLATLGPADLVEQGLVTTAVNALVLEDRAADALALADRSIAAYDALPRPAPDAAPGPGEYDPIAASGARVARADALFGLGQMTEANKALLDATRLVDNPDGQLIRRARVALAQGDRYGALAYIRRLLQLYPFNGQSLWFYATLLEPVDQEMFFADLDAAMTRLHPDQRPLDYLVVAHEILGRHEEALKFMGDGLARDCDPITERPQRLNCEAWYHALGRVELDEAVADIDAALTAEGPRSDFLDTKAMVHLARGEVGVAADAALKAARLSPDDVYMLWQAERIAQIAAAAGTSPSPAPSAP